MDKLDVLMNLYREEWAQRRHYRELRARMAGVLLATAGAVVAVITIDKRVDRGDILPGIMLCVIGLFGASFSKIKHDRYDLHLDRTTEILKEVDSTLGAPVTEVLTRGTESFRKKHPKSDWLRLDVMYYTLYTCVVIVGGIIVAMSAR